VNKSKGVTLLEVMLVLLIGSLLILLAVRQYQQYQLEQYALQLKYNVDSLLQAMSYYYRANCETGKLSPSQLVPFPPTQLAYSLSLDKNDFVGYLPNNFQPMNPLVDNSVDDYGYSTQFNFFQVGQKNANACFSFWGTGATPVGCNTPAAIPDTVVVGWQLQVIVKMSNPATTTNYLGLTGADCAVDESDLPTNKVVDCSKKNTDSTPTYLVWQRSPSFATPAVSSSAWMSTPVLKMFNLQYTHDPMFELYMNNTATTSYYYLCGG